MGELNERTIDGIESVHRNALFIDPKYYHLNGEQIQALRDAGVDTESQSRREVQVLIEGEVDRVESQHDFPELATEGQDAIEGEVAEKAREDYGGISSFASFHSESKCVIADLERQIEDGIEELR